MLRPHAKLWIFMYTLDLCKILCTMAVQNSEMSVQNCVCAAVCLDIPRFLHRPLGERPCIHVYTHQISRDQLTCIYQLPYECIQHQQSHYYSYRPLWRDWVLNPSEVASSPGSPQLFNVARRSWEKPAWGRSMRLLQKSVRINPFAQG